MTDYPMSVKRKRFSPVTKKMAVVLLGLSLMASFPSIPAGNDKAPSRGDYYLQNADASFWGENGGDTSGCAVEFTGDINGDGYDDLLIGAASKNNYRGWAYQILGKPAGWLSDVNLSNSQSSFYPVNDNAHFGCAVTGAGDMNGDGYDDIAIGSSYDGRVYLFFGGASGWPANNSCYSANASFVQEEDWSGTGDSIAGAGDVNGDGFDDLLIGSPFYQNGLGKTYLIFGKQTGWKMNTSLIYSSASFIAEEENAYAGWSVAGAGDINGDGFDDILIGAPYPDEKRPGRGKIYLMLGKAGGWSSDLNLSQADASFLGEIVGDSAGFSVTGAGDVNGDGYDDMLFGAPYHSDFTYILAGKAYLVFGKPSGWTQNENLSRADVCFVGSKIFPGAYPALGWEVAGNGDLNGDGYDDILIGAPNINSIGIGEVHLILGKKEDWTARIELGPDSITEETRFLAEVPNDCCGRVISCNGDANGDGFDDILIGAYYNPENGPYSGQTYLVFPYRNYPPTSFESLKAFSDTGFSEATSFAIRNDTLYIEMRGSDGNPNARDIVRVNVTSSGSKRSIELRLRETGANTGIYQGNFTLMNRTHDDKKWIKATDGDKLRISPFGRPENVTQINVGRIRVRSLSAAELVATEDEAYLLNLTADNSTSSAWTFKTNASWLELNASAGKLTGTPDNSKVGTFWALLNATDGFGRANGLNITITVKNAPPEILTADRTTALEDVRYRVDYNSSDDGQGSISWSLLADTAPWLSINETSGVLEGLPDNDDVGEHAVRVSVEDGNGGLDWTSFMLNVTNMNDRPVITTGDVTNATEDVLYVVDYEVLDPDVTDIEFRWSVETSAGWLSMNGSTGVLSGTPSNEDVGNHSVNVSVKDAMGASDFHNFTLQVQNVNDPPIWKDVPSNVKLVEGESYLFDVNASDVDIGDTLAYGLKTDPATDPVIGTGSGLLAWTPAAAGNYIFNVSASDGRVSIFHEFVMTVEIAWKPPVVRLLAPLNGSLVNNTNLTFTVEGDPDTMGRVPINISLYLGQDLGKVEAKDASAKLNVTLTILKSKFGTGSEIRADYLLKGPLLPNTTYYWTAVPFDDTGKGICGNGVFSFKVINHVPSLSTVPGQEVKTGKAFSYQVQAGDADLGDGANLTFSLENAPTGMTIDARTGLISWRPGKDAAGRHAIRIIVADGHGGTAGQDLIVTVEGQKAVAPATINLQYIMFGAILLIAVVATTAAFLAIRKKRTAGQTPPDGIAGETRPAMAESIMPPEAGTVAETPAAAAPPLPVPPVPATTGTGPAGFSVDDVFLMFRDGRLIQHSTRRLQADMDVDVVTSMLTAVQEFIKESFGKSEGGELGSMEYGESKIMLEKGKHIVLAAVIGGREPDGFRDELRSAVQNVESEFAAVLPTWDGTTNKLAGAKRFLAALGSFAPAQAVADQLIKADVTLKSELEFYQGFVRLKVAVKNRMPTMIAMATFKLIYNYGVFRLDHVEPELERNRDEITLGIVESGEKRTVAFYLDPQICTESHLEGVLTYKDAKGALETLKMPRKLASVVCPILFTDENINTAMLKRMAADELDRKDTKVFSTPAGISPQKAFELAKAAIQHHDVRLVRELVEKDPFIGEAWYYGKVKGRQDKVITRARVIADQNFLEFFVASNSTLMLTGMLAELKTDLNQELEGQKIGSRLKQVTSQDEVDALARLRTLLDRTSEAGLSDSGLDGGPGR